MRRISIVKRKKFPWIGIDKKKKLPNYSKDLDYLFALIYFMGTSTNGSWRKPADLAKDLSLDRGKVLRVLNSYPGLFRKSITRDKGDTFTLQARYAQFIWVDGQKKPENDGPMELDKLHAVVDFTVKASEREQIVAVASRSGRMATSAAIASAIIALGGVILAVILPAYLGHSNTQP